ncbi:MAG: hypothetical protein ACREX8_08775 [Gammaproteobacteria bacterium]
MAPHSFNTITQPWIGLEWTTNGDQSAISPCPGYYRLLVNDRNGLPTTVIAGPDRRRAWLYVHARTPTVLRLHPPVVRFLRDALTDLNNWLEPSTTERGTLTWILSRRDYYNYPDCILTARDGQAWLNVLAATPSTVQLHRPLMNFLRATLAQLPTAKRSYARRSIGQWSEIADAELDYSYTFDEAEPPATPISS